MDLLAYSSSCHLSTVSYAKKVSHLVTNAGGLGETGRLTFGIALALLTGGLNGSLHYTRDILTKGLEVSLDSSKIAGELLELGRKLSKTLVNKCGRVAWLGISCLNSWFRSRGRCGGGLNLGCGLGTRFSLSSLFGSLRCS